MSETRFVSARSCARANDAKIVLSRVRNAIEKKNTKESP